MEFTTIEWCIVIFTSIFLLLALIYLPYRVYSFVTKRRLFKKWQLVLTLIIYLLVFACDIAAAVLFIHSFVNIYNRYDLSVMTPFIMIGISGLLAVISEILLMLTSKKHKKVEALKCYRRNSKFF